MKFRRGHVGEKLEGRIERLGGPDRHDRQHKPAPFRRGNAEENTRCNHDHGYARMNPCIVLRPQHGPDARERELKAADPAGKLEWLSLHWIITILFGFHLSGKAFLVFIIPMIGNVPKMGGRQKGPEHLRWG